MKASLLILPVLMGILSGCGIQEAVQRNQDAVNMSTCAIYENVQAIQMTNRVIDENRRKLTEINETLDKAKQQSQ